MIPRVRRVLVLGGGSAGFLAALTCKTLVPDLDVEMVRSPEIGIIGVGEATTPTLPTHLHGVLNLDLHEFYRAANPSWKMGIRFLWGPRAHFNYSFRSQCDSQYLRLSRPTGFYYREAFENGDIGGSLMDIDQAFLRRPDGFPVVERDAAYHLENETFVRYLENQARRIGIVIHDDTVLDVLQNDYGVAALRLGSGGEMTADLFIDCSGFRSVLLGQALKGHFLSFKKSLFCDRAIVGSWARTTEPILPYTVAETMNSGWSWQIEHEHSINRGYVFSSDFITEDEAMQEFSAKNPKVTHTRLVKFFSGRYQDSWMKNVVAVGNSSGFVEPLESTALGAIAVESQAIAETLRDTPERRVTDSQIRAFNNRAGRGWDCIRDFLAIHYRFNRRINSPFWRSCLADVDLAGATEVVEYYQENGPSVLWRDALLDRYDQFKMDGYLTLLIGQQVPYNADFTPSAEESIVWRRIQEANRSEARNAMSVAEAMQAIRSPQWTWDNKFYRDKPRFAVGGL